MGIQNCTWQSALVLLAVCLGCTMYHVEKAKDKFQVSPLNPMGGGAVDIIMGIGYSLVAIFTMISLFTDNYVTGLLC